MSQKSLLAQAHPSLRELFRELSKENAKLHREVARLEARNISLKHRVAAVLKGNELRVIIRDPTQREANK